MKAKDLGYLIKATAKGFSSDKATRLGAALAYYSVFSIGPLLMIVIAIAGLVFGEEAVRGELFGQLRGLIGDQGAQITQTMVQAAAAKPRTGTVASIVGAITLLIGATGVITQLKDSLNTIWKVQPKPGAGLRYFVKTYIVSLAAILGIGFLLMVSLVLSASLAAIGKFAAGLLPIPESVLQLANVGISFAVITMLFAFMFKFLPDVKLRWSDVWLGAALTSLLFSIGKLGIGVYLGKQSIGSTYGAAGSLVVLLIWIYYSSLIFFIGAELTEVYTRWAGKTVRPTPEVQPLTKEDMVEQGLRGVRAAKSNSGHRPNGTTRPATT